MKLFYAECNFKAGDYDSCVIAAENLQDAENIAHNDELWSIFYTRGAQVKVTEIVGATYSGKAGIILPK